MFLKRSTIPLVAVAAAALTACSPPNAQSQKPSAGIPKVTVVQPQVTTVTNWDEYPGHLEAVEAVDIRPQVSGYLKAIHFQDGAEVKAGDLLFEIDPKPYQAELDRAQAERASAEVRLELAKNDLKRAESLRASRAISDEEYDSRSKAVRSADSALAAAKASETMAQINLDYTKITAPISGKIGRRTITPGNLVQLQGNGGAATVLATVVSMDPIYCYFDANESAYLTYRKTGTATGQIGSIPCQLVLGSDQSFSATGSVDFFDNQVEEKTGTIRMRAVFANADHSLVPGLFANVRVPAGPAQQVTLIPEEVINSDQGHKYVLVVGKTNTVEIRPIVVGRTQGTMRAVTSGLTAEDRVILNGQMMMMPRPGMPVEVATAPTAPAAAASDAKAEAKN